MPQNSDKAQGSIGTMTGSSQKMKTPRTTSAGSIIPSGNKVSGSSQGKDRGKQGMA